MRVTFLLPRYGWQASGGFRVVYTYASLLVQRGCSVSVIHPRRLPPGGWPRAAGAVGRARRAAGRVRDVVLRPRIRWAEIDPRVTMRYVPAIADQYVPPADAVIATWWSTAEAALALSPDRGRRFHLIQGHEIWNGAEERVHAAWRAPLHKIFIARWLLELGLELGIAEDATTLIPNAIDTRTFRVAQPPASRARHIAMLYSTEPYKGGPLGIEMLERAKQRVPDLTAALFGVVRAPRSLPEWIEFTRNATPGELAASIYNRAAVYLCASLSEGWHLPPAEAMACGCAVVSSDIGGVRDYAVQGDTAMLYAPGDVAAGAECLVRLLTDDAARLALAERGRDAIARFSWDRSADELLTVLRERS
jgi:L-malate glycosyltransferase